MNSVKICQDTLPADRTTQSRAIIKRDEKSPRGPMGKSKGNSKSLERTRNYTPACSHTRNEDDKLTPKGEVHTPSPAAIASARLSKIEMFNSDDLQRVTCVSQHQIDLVKEIEELEQMTRKQEREHRPFHFSGLNTGVFATQLNFTNEVRTKVVISLRLNSMLLYFSLL
jgi:hypothetical protein